MSNGNDLTHSRLAAQAAAAWLVRVVRLQGRGAYVLAHHGALVIRIRGTSAVLSSGLSAVTSTARLGRCHGHADEAVAPLVGMQVDLAVQRPEQRGIVEDRRAEGSLNHARSVPHNGREQLTWRWCVLVEDGAQRSLPGNQWQSVAISGNQWQSVAIRLVEDGAQRSLPGMGARAHAPFKTGNQGQSREIKSNQGPSRAIKGNQGRSHLAWSTCARPFKTGVIRGLRPPSPLLLLPPPPPPSPLLLLTMFWNAAPYDGWIFPTRREPSRPLEMRSPTEMRSPFGSSSSASFSARWARSSAR